MKIKYIIISLLLFHSYNVYSEDDITPLDLKIIENADVYSVAITMNKIKNNYNIKGKEAISIAINSIIYRVNDIIKKNQNFSEPEGEVFADLIWALSVSGDERIKPIFLNLLSFKRYGSPNIAKGFMTLDKSIVYDIIDSLKSGDMLTRSKTISILSKMYEYDIKKEYFNQNNKINIKDNLFRMITKENNIENLLIFQTIKYFGNNSDIIFLKNIINNIHEGRFKIKEEIQNSIKYLEKTK